jgi:glycosyltransferase involved in cell wall biosynthesis
VQPGDSDALVKAMTRVASDPELRDRLGGQAKLQSSMFDIAKASRSMGDIYLQVSREH